MRIKKILLFVGMLALLCGASAEGRTLSESEARQVAGRFFTSHGKSCTPQVVERSARRAPGRLTTAPAYYVFNTGSELSDGFVIVSGDDRAVPVLGYSDTGSFDPANVPPAMQEWLDGLSAEIESLGDDESAQYAPQRALGAKIAPMVTCNWDQNAPYNLQLPTVNSGERAATGCVATAMAQMMYYHRWPVESTAIPAYTSETQSIYRPELPAVAFDWANMQDNYKAADTGAAADAVAQLMLYCGQAVTMDFKNESSSASSSDIPVAFQTYFNYAPSVRYVKRENYTKDAWAQMLYAELKAKRPVVYSGATMANSGHAFICDGYDNATGLFHINWGWGGGSNGYYALSALTTKIQGTGGSSGTEGYVARQAMVVGIVPGNQSAAPTTAMTFSDLSVTATTYTRSSSSSDFTGVTFSGRFNNYTGSTRSFVSGWALYQGNTRISVLTSESSNTYLFTDLKDGWGRTSTFNLRFGAGLAAGTYRLVPISKLRPNGSWEECVGSDVNYVEAKITTTTLTLTPCGVNGIPKYTVNNVDYEGFKHASKTIKVIANITNSGTSMNNKIYLFVDGVKTTMEMLDINPGEAGDITFFYRPETVGTKTLKFTLNEDGTNPIATRSLTVEEMPAANLTMKHNVANLVTSTSGRKLNSNTAVVTTTVTNKGNAYNEEVMAYLCKVTEKTATGYRGSIVRRVTLPLTLAAGATADITLTFDELITGEMYFINYYYFSSGEEVKASGVSTFTVAGGTPSVRGDVDGNGSVDVDDMNIIINIMLRKATLQQWPMADVDGNGVVDIDDMNVVINIMVHKA